MAETLAPMLSGGAASYERPTNQGGSYFGAAGALLDFFGQATAPDLTPREPTADERFSQAWRQAQEQAGIRLDPENPSYQENLRGFGAQFIATYPEFESQASGILESAGVTTTLNRTQQGTDALTTAINEFITTNPLGQAANVAALAAARRPDGTYDQAVYDNQLTQAYQAELGMQAELERITRESNALTATENIRSTVSTNYWNAFKPSAENIVDSAFIDIRDIVTQMREDPGGQAYLDEALAAQMGFSSNVINQNNFVPFLIQYRSAIQRGLRDTLAQNPNIEPSLLRPADEQWYNEVLAPLDSLIAAGRVGFEDASAVLTNENALEQSRVIRDIRANDPALANALVLNDIAPELSTQILTAMEGLGLNDRIGRYILTSFGADVAPEDVVSRVQDMSTEEARQNLVAAEATLATGQATGHTLQNSLLIMFESVNRTQGTDRFLPLDMWNGRVINNAAAIEEQASSDPAFANDISIRLMSDLNMTVQQVRNELNSYPGAVLVQNEDGTLGVAIDEAAINAILDSRGLDAGTRAQALDDMLNVASLAADIPVLQTFNTKVQSLSNLQSIGPTVVDAYLVNNPATVQGAGGEPSPGGGMSQSQSSPTSGGLVALIDRTEGAGDYDTLYSHSNREGGAFAGTRVSNMTIGQLIEFADGEYGNWSVGQLGYKATPMGRYQFVGSTLEATARDMGLSMDTVFTPEVQDAMFAHKVAERLRGANTIEEKMTALRAEWHGFRNVSNEELASAILAFEQGEPLSFSGGGITVAPGLLAPSASVRPLARQETQPLSPPTRPQARPTSEAPMQSVRPQARPTRTQGQGASSQTVKDQRNRAIEVLTRGGFTKEELSALGIY